MILYYLQRLCSIGEGNIKKDRHKKEIFREVINKILLIEKTVTVV
jgi:hypothetical protein